MTEVYYWTAPDGGLNFGVLVSTGGVVRLYYIRSRSGRCSHWTTTREEFDLWLSSKYSNPFWIGHHRFEKSITCEIRVDILLVVANQVCATDYIAVDLNPSGFIEAYAEGISGSQQVGWGYGPATGGNDHALVWSGSAASAVDLHPSVFDNSFAYGISDGQQVGYAIGSVTSGYEHAMLWCGTAASAVDLNPDGISRSYAWDISGGQQVGQGYGAATGNYYHALLWSGTAASVVDLNPSGFAVSKAVGVQWRAAGGLRLWIGHGQSLARPALEQPTAASAVDLNPNGFEQFCCI